MRSLVLCLALATAALTACGDDALVAPDCADGVQNGGESGVDCGGGVCGACPEGGGCAHHADCASGVCGTEGTCVAPSCADGVMNTDESDVDCGGGCSPCAAGDACSAAADCASGVCDGGTCAGAACGDGVVNGDEACDDGGESAACNADCTAATCGDFMVNHTAGETCDEGGEATATCDADCTLRSCGDGVANTDAGEQCDTGGSSATCDLDCTEPLCGDGLHNPAADEDCDDGGDSYRCNADCRLAVCGDDYVNTAAGEVCEEGAVDTATCNADCTAAVCGDGYVNAAAGEACDDGNDALGDGCRPDCTIELCGDGILDVAAGEHCDDGDTAPDDGCSEHCTLEDPFVTRAPQAISGDDMRCTTTPSNVGRKVASDAMGTLYVAMTCGGEAYVAASHDRGATYLDPVLLTQHIGNVFVVAVEGGPANTAYAVIGTQNQELFFTRTIDGGLTWEAPTTLAATGILARIGMDSRGDSLFIAATPGNATLRVWRNHSRGSGSFDVVDVAQAHNNHDLICDKVTGDVFTVSETMGSQTFRRSTDGAVSFGDPFEPPGQAFVADWAGSNGYVYMVGSDFYNDDTDTDIDVIPTSDPSSGYAASGLTSMGALGARAIDADGMGNAYVISQLESGAIQLDRLVVGASSVSGADARLISATGTYPSVAALPSHDGAVITYTVGNQVMAAVLVY